MEPNSDQETIESKASENLDTLPETNMHDRRTFLRQAAIGVAGTAGLVAIGASTAQAESSAKNPKSRILERIKAQLARDAVPVNDTSGTSIYLKAPDWEDSGTSMYLKAPDWP